MLLVPLVVNVQMKGYRLGRENYSKQRYDGQETGLTSTSALNGRATAGLLWGR
jgi:hypothetical protein